ncbi:MAG: sporulation integral membrane protein YtvI [Lachnospiraceae bacterium]|nr:sporulation integral membrane protein YtvI [Lachnospiraceae bacterium]
MNEVYKKKLNVCVFAIAATVLMYLIFRFVFPVLLPFLLALLYALLILPVVRFMDKKLGFKRGVATGIVMIITIVLVFTLGNWILSNLMVQLRNFIANYGYYEELILGQLEAIGENISRILHLEENIVGDMVSDNLALMGAQIEERLVSLFMDNSVSLLKWIITFVVGAIVAFIATFLISKDWEKLKASAENCFFADELGLFASKLSSVGSAYLKTQVILMMITMTICVAGFTIQRNPYSLLLGVLIGFLDALPLVGSGLFFIPWIISVLLMGNYFYAFGLLIIYLLCYFVREFLEPKLMGHGVGASALEMLISMFAGLQLFGFMGLFLGPVGYILLKELLKQNG